MTKAEKENKSFECSGFCSSCSRSLGSAGPPVVGLPCGPPSALRPPWAEPRAWRPPTCRAVSSAAGPPCSGSSCKDGWAGRGQRAPGRACLPPARLCLHARLSVLGTGPTPLLTPSPVCVQEGTATSHTPGEGRARMVAACPWTQMRGLLYEIVSFLEGQDPAR